LGLLFLGSDKRFEDSFLEGVSVLVPGFLECSEGGGEDLGVLCKQKVV
jgi:hypothetical protein